MTFDILCEKDLKNIVVQYMVVHVDVSITRHKYKLNIYVECYDS